jgi:hypothetical protein
MVALAFRDKNRTSARAPACGRLNLRHSLPPPCLIHANNTAQHERLIIGYDDQHKPILARATAPGTRAFYFAVMVGDIAGCHSGEWAAGSMRQPRCPGSIPGRFDKNLQSFRFIPQLSSINAINDIRLDCQDDGNHRLQEGATSGPRTVLQLQPYNWRTISS